MDHALLVATLPLQLFNHNLVTEMSEDVGDVRITNVRICGAAEPSIRGTAIYETEHYTQKRTVATLWGIKYRRRLSCITNVPSRACNENLILVS